MFSTASRRSSPSEDGAGSVTRGISGLRKATGADLADAMMLGFKRQLAEKLRARKP
jgi:hypothetical protein